VAMAPAEAVARRVELVLSARRKLAEEELSWVAWAASDYFVGQHFDAAASTLAIAFAFHGCDG
jgi:hypothetical protein